MGSRPGGVQVMHAVPHTLVALGYYSGVDALKEASRHSKRFMDHANQTPGKPDSYLNMLVELDSRQEIQPRNLRLGILIYRSVCVLESLGRRLNFHPAVDKQRENTHRHTDNTDKDLAKGTHGLCAGACAMRHGVGRGAWVPGSCFGSVSAALFSAREESEVSENEGIGEFVREECLLSPTPA